MIRKTVYDRKREKERKIVRQNRQREEEEGGGSKGRWRLYVVFSSCYVLSSII